MVLAEITPLSEAILLWICGRKKVGGGGGVGGERVDRHTESVGVGWVGEM